jgi:hypothetical protein
MKSSVLRYTYSLLVITGIATVALLVYNKLTPEALPGYTYIALIYYTLLSWATFRITHSAITKNNKIFFSRVYSAIGIRFVFSLFPLVIYLFFIPLISVPFVIAYLLFYLLFTSFEIYFLVVNLRPDFNKPQP